jgi:hypothetical protein
MPAVLHLTIPLFVNSPAATPISPSTIKSNGFMAKLWTALPADTVPVPEPSTLGLLSAGVICIARVIRDDLRLDRASARQNCRGETPSTDVKLVDGRYAMLSPLLVPQVGLKLVHEQASSSFSANGSRLVEEHRLTPILLSSEAHLRPLIDTVLVFTNSRMPCTPSSPAVARMFHSPKWQSRI